MPRMSPLGIEGTGLSYRDFDEQGRPTVAQVRAKDENGVWQARRFDVTSWKRDGTPVLPEGSKEWARETRKSFVKGTEFAGVATVQEFLGMVAEDAATRGVGSERVQLINRVGERLHAAGIKDMKSLSFATRVRSWLDGLTVNWAFAADFKYRRTSEAKLSAATKNKLLIIIRQATALAVLRRRLAFDPLVELKPFKGSKQLKALFTVDEMATLVSEHARTHAIHYRSDLDQRINAMGMGRMEGVRAVAKAEGVHWTTIYNRLRAEPVEDPWWLPACLLTYTGARAQEALHLRWEWIKWDARIITLKRRDDFDIKSDAERNIALEPELAEILRPRAKINGWIIEDSRIRQGGSGKPNKKTGEIPRDYQAAFAAYCKRIGIDPGDRTVHSLRHCFITAKIARADMNLDRLRKNVGHQNIKTTQGYSEQSQEYEAIVDKWPDSSLWLRRSISGKQYKEVQ